MGRTTVWWPAIILITAFLSGCVAPPPPKPKLTLEPVPFSHLPGWRRDQVANAIPALLRSCARRLAQPANAAVGPRGLAGMVKDWQAPCAAAARVPANDNAAARQFLQRWFVPYLAGNNGNPSGLFTGYYEPLLDGAPYRGGPFETPILRRPPDLVMVQLGLFRPEWRGDRIAGRVVHGRLVPYPTRAQIERGAIDAGKLALFWVRDPVGAFFLQIQGSGKIRLPDGRLVSVGYDGQNGRPYVAIGRLLVERGAMARREVSLAAIAGWIKTHPARGRALMDENPSYVFFRVVKGKTPIGAEGVVLTPRRSLAVDRRFLPLGIPVWLDLANGDKMIQRLVVAQDTGGAIRGPVRGDLYWGAGPAAARSAGGMIARGRYFLLLPKDLESPTSARR
jgi:peptidoglycan lytic transglycosylase A